MTSICETGISNAVDIMRSGQLNRYQMDAGDETCYLLRTEAKLAKYLGVRYALGLNSGGSAIFLALKCGGLTLGAPVLTNAFTFNAVPSAIAHAGGKVVLVECTDSLTMDLADLERKVEKTGARFLVLSYMRGRVPDMDEVMRICKKHSLYLIEDAAHAYGIEWKGQKIGSFGESACLSTQANKLMNSGEGGFLLTSDDHVMAKAIISAGSYEQLFRKHVDLCPPIELLRKYRMTEINYSMRMTNLQGAILYPQVAQLDKRRDEANVLYAYLAKAISKHPRLRVPGHLSAVTPVHDTIQFQVLGSTPEELRVMAKAVQQKGYKLGVFGLVENARNWKTWKFLEGVDQLLLPCTDQLLQSCCDIRLHIGMSKEEADRLKAAIFSAVDRLPASRL